MSEELELFSGMIRFVQSVQRQAEARLADREVSAGQFQVLSTLERRGALRQKEIVEALGVTKGNVSQLLAKLERAGFVERSAEGVSKVVTLTGPGRALVAELRPSHAAFLAERFAALGSAERRALREILAALEASQSDP